MSEKEKPSKVKIVDLKTKKQSEVTCEAWKHLQTITFEKGKKRYAEVVETKMVSNASTAKLALNNASANAVREHGDPEGSKESNENNGSNEGGLPPRGE